MYARPEPGEYAPFYAGYVSLVPEPDILPVLAAQPGELSGLASSVAEGRETWRYGPEKWSVRQVFGHMVDGERVFGYRAFCVSRGETKALPGFEENEYVAAARFDERPLAELVREFAAVREANLAVFRRVPAEAWGNVGNANGSAVSLRALAAIMAGHVRHHTGVLRARYEVGAPPR